MNNPLVVGYKGEIGSFILNGLLRVMPKALNILCVDVNETVQEAEERIVKSDVIFLCVPMEDTFDWLIRWGALLRDKVVIEQCSLKEWIYGDERLRGLNLKSMHILFRPSQTPNLADRRVGFLAGQFDHKLMDVITDITQAQPIGYMDADHHDKQMAIQQALAHRVILTLGTMLRGCPGFTYVSSKIIDLDVRIRGGDKELYKAIQGNRHLVAALEKFEQRLAEFNMSDYMGS